MWNYSERFLDDLRNGKEKFTAEWRNHHFGNRSKLQRLELSVKDLLAYKQWKINFNKWLNTQSELNSCADWSLWMYEDFAIQYLNFAKIGTNIAREEKGDFIINRGILTADFMPYVTFDKYIREYAFPVVRTERLDYDEKKRDFFGITPSLFHIKADEKKKLELELDLGIKL